jgi:NADH:ubiquinone oxidoreductase subunit 3 (subunit A)
MDSSSEAFLVYAVVATVFVVATIVLNRIFGARKPRTYLQDTTYECGEEAEGEAQVDFPSHHYVFAVVFVAVDVFGFLLALWAVSLQSLVNYWETTATIAGVFTVIALVGIYYVLRGEKSLWV